jgi:molecular chaperone DnaK
MSFEPFARIEEEFIAEKDGVPLHLNIELQRSDYETLIEPLLEKTLVCVDEALSDSKLTANQIDRVILVGGASRTPLVHRMLQEQLDQPIHTEVDPDLCVSMGAAVQGGLIAGMDLGPVLVDITPHTLGTGCIGLVHGVTSPYCCVPIIERNTPLPASRSDVFCTHYDGQTEVEVSVFQGENPDLRNNEAVGDFMLEGLADVEHGNEILVRFDLDLDGILTVTATEKATGLKKQVRIDNPMARFRSNNREAAQQRLNNAFGDDGETPGQPPAFVEPKASREEPQETLSAEMQAAVDNAQELIQRADDLMEEANEMDAEEMRELLGQLRAAIGRRSLEDMSDISAKLDDLVFYLQDVT